MPGVRSCGYWMPEKNLSKPQQTHAVQVEVDLQICAAAESKLGRWLGKLASWYCQQAPKEELFCYSTCWSAPSYLELQQKWHM